MFCSVAQLRVVVLEDVEEVPVYLLSRLGAHHTVVSRSLLLAINLQIEYKEIPKIHSTTCENDIPSFPWVKGRLHKSNTAIRRLIGLSISVLAFFPPPQL